MKSPPIFVVGNSRSGTTMLRLMLTCHPKICIPPEGPFATLLLTKYQQEANWTDARKEEFFDEVLKSQKIHNWRIDSSECREFFLGQKIENYSHAVSGIYDCYRAFHDPEAARWGDKSGTVNLKRFKQLCRSLHDRKFVHIVRDGRDVFCSYRGVAGIEHRHSPNLPTCPLQAAAQWSKRVNAIDHLLNQFESNCSLTIRYEDLVNNQEDTLRKICEFVEEPFSADMMRFAEINAKKELEPKEFLKWKSKTVEPVTTSQVERWKKELEPDEIAAFELIAKNVLEKFNYQVSNHKTTLGWRMRNFQFQGKLVAKRVLSKLKKLVS